MDLKKIVIGLAIGAVSIVGCGDDDDDTTPTTPTTVTTAPDLGPTVDSCDDAGTPVVYRLNMLRIPDQDDIDNGNDLGHNVDGLGTVCDTPDYIGGVDNSLLDLAATLPSLGGGTGLDLNTEIAAALNCTDTTMCTPLLLDVSVASGTGCVAIDILDGEDGTNLAGQTFYGTLEGGSASGRVDEFALSIPFEADDGSTINIALTVSNVILTADLTATSIDNIVLGGVLDQTSFEATLRTIVPEISQDISVDEVLGILGGLYDVQTTGTACDGLSVGLTGSGVLAPTTTAVVAQ